MINCLYVPENTTTYSFIYNTALSYDKSDLKTCLILPTERNVRYMANCGFKYIEPYTISSIFEMVIKTDKKIMPAELRPFYLKKAIAKLTKEEITAVFKSDNEEFLSSFIPFIQNVNNIFSFYRELFAEMVDIKSLVKAGKYSDYENQINILNHLWNIYTDLIHKEGFIDKYETYIDIKLNNLFIERYDKYIFLISGFLAKYEMKIIKMISEIKDVTVIFNYAGKRQNQHKEYESYFETDNLIDKNLPVFSKDNMQFYSCSSNISQIDLITKKAFELNIKNNIPFNRMAVIMPDTSCKTYFIQLDYYNLFDISDGRDINAFSFYNLINNALNTLSLINNNLIDIKAVINMISDEVMQKNEDVKSLYIKLNKMLDNNKLYLETDKFFNEPFIKEYLSDFFKSTKTGTISEFINVYKNLLYKFLEFFILEQDIIKTTILHLDKLEITYNNINDILSFDEASYIIMNEVNKLTVDLPKKEIAVTGILESRNTDYDILFIPYMTEELFPPKSPKDLFINTEIRMQLNLPTFIDRENLMKNYLYQLMSNAKLNIISYSDNNSASRRSSFLEELSVKYNIKELKYAPNVISLIQDKIYHYPKDEPLYVEKNDKIITHLKEFKYSASNLNIYNACSFKFYLKYILKIDEKTEPAISLDNQIFGIVIHSVFKNLFDRKISALDKNYLQEFQKEYLNQIQQYDAFKYSSVEQFISSIIYNNLPKIAAAETMHAKEGFVETNREYNINIKFNKFNITGYIDKIETYKQDIFVTDYKYKDMKKIKPVLNNDFKKVEDIQLPIYAMLIKSEMKKMPADLFYFSLKEDFKYISGFDTSFYDDFKEYLKGVLNEIVDINTPFKQTEETKTCDFCQYAAVCGRENGFFSK